MIPSWTAAGVLPPIRPGKPGHSSDRSPYRIELWQLIDRFASSANRTSILTGFLNYRAELHSVGITSGFQWLDGSFMEDVETLESRPPKDIDVVTHFYLPVGDNQTSLEAKKPELFDHDHVKTTYHVDGYPHILGEPVDELRVRLISYWYSMWSHRRTHTWKGFVQVDLNPAQDIHAKNVLNGILSGGVTP